MIEFVHFFDGGYFERAAGIIDQKIDFAKGIQGFLECAFKCFRTGHVTGKGNYFRSGCPADFGRRFEGFFIAVDHHQPYLVKPGKQFRGGFREPRAYTGDYCHFSI